MTRASWTLAAALVLSACNSVHIENVALPPNAANVERRRVVPSAPDRPAIFMTFSGGGTRAAALSAAILEELANTSYASGDGRHALGDDVKFVSSVSGGSVTAAWLGLLDHPPTAGDFADLRTNFLAYDGTSDLESKLYNPGFWFREAFTSYVRIGALEDMLDRRLYRHADFGAMNRVGRPLVVLNATDMAGGETFDITPERFDDICSSLDDLPVSAGVAASAAFPILLSPVNLKDYSTGCTGAPRAASWAKIDTSVPAEAIVNLEQYRAARYSNDLRHGAYPFRDIDYLHLLDGGLADNLGINSLRAALTGTHNDAKVLQAINEGRIKRLVVITVNARSDKPSALYRSASSPGIVSMFNSVTSVPIDANSASSQEVLGTLLGDIAAAAKQAPAAQFGNLAVYGITIDFDQIPADTAQNRELRDRAKDVPTSWSLTRGQLDTTEEAGRFLLLHNPCFQALVSDLHASSPHATAPPMPALCPTRADSGG